MTTPAEGPANEHDSDGVPWMERTRGIVAGWQGLSEGPATVTLCECVDRMDTSKCPVHGGKSTWLNPAAEGPATVTLTDEAARLVEWAGRDSWTGEVVTDLVAHVGALTADLAAARVALDAMMERDTAASVRYDALAVDHRRWVDKAFEAEQVIANVRALHERPTVLLNHSDLTLAYENTRRALLPAAPTGEEK